MDPEYKLKSLEQVEIDYKDLLTMVAKDSMHFLSRAQILIERATTFDHMTRDQSFTKEHALRAVRLGNELGQALAYFSTAHDMLDQMLGGVIPLNEWEQPRVERARDDIRSVISDLNDGYVAVRDYLQKQR